MNQVYFIKPVGGSGPVKIGYTALIRDRIAGLNAWSPTPLEVAATIDGDAELERRFHARFVSSRDHGEWFNMTPELADVIARINAGTFDTNELPEPVRLAVKKTPPGNSGAVYDPDLLADVMAFCKLHDVAPATFGRAVTNDPALVRNLLQGRQPRRRVNARIRSFMATYSAPAQQVAA